MLSTLSTKKEIQNLNFETLTSIFTLFLIQPQLPLTAGMSHTAHFKLKWACCLTSVIFSSSIELM